MKTQMDQMNREKLRLPADIAGMKSRLCRGEIFGLRLQVKSFVTLTVK